MKRARSGVIAALSLGVAILGMSASHAATAGGGTLRVEGAVKSPRTFDVAALQALGADTVSWEYRGGTRSVIGVPLIRVLEACGPWTGRHWRPSSVRCDWRCPPTPSRAAACTMCARCV